MARAGITSYTHENIGVPINPVTWIQSTNVTDGQTHRQTLGDSKDRAYA